MRRRARLAAIGCAAAAALGACITIEPSTSNAPASDDASTDDGAATGDATTQDGNSTDAPLSDAPPSDARPDGGDSGQDAGPPTYHDATNAAFWDAFDLANVNPDATAFWGAAFDGRYLYLSPGAATGANGLTVRFDTAGPLHNASSYATYYLASADARLTGFAGAAFDGRYVYFVPNPTGAIARYDTTLSFGSPAGISVFDSTAVAGGAQGFAGATIDPGGKYLYFSPHDNGAPDGLVLRYSFAGGFDAGGAYEINDRSSVAKGFRGAAFDGRYAYFVPYGYFDNTLCGGCASGFRGSSVILQYDTKASFSASASFTTFDLHAVGAADDCYQGAVFDGRYVYFVPRDPTLTCTCQPNIGCQNTCDNAACGCSNPGTPALVRYDTQAAPDAGTGAYEAFNTVGLAGNPTAFAGGVFDGRYVYLVPAYGSLVVRYDTQGAFGAPGSYVVFDASKLSPGAKGFSGGAFDGRYVYLVPGSGTVLVRFDAKTPPSMPPGYTGSFF